MVELFPITKCIGNAFKLDLSLFIKIHPIFLNKLYEAVMDPLLGQSKETPEPIVISEENV